MLAARREKVAIIREFQGTAIKVFKSGVNKAGFGLIAMDCQNIWNKLISLNSKYGHNLNR
jgi:hypothetical protein